MSEPPVVLDVDLAQFETILSAVAPGQRGERVDWVEDDLHPYTEEDRLRAARFCWLLDNHGPEVARLWMDEGCPVPFNWTEVIRSPDG